jgi:hypothetical protein
MTVITPCAKGNPCEQPCFGAIPGCPYVAVNDSVSDVPYLAAREVRLLRQQLAGAVEALRRIERLPSKWEATPTGDRAPWAVVGSEAHKIAADCLKRGAVGL